MPTVVLFDEESDSWQTAIWTIVNQLQSDQGFKQEMLLLVAVVVTKSTCLISRLRNNGFPPEEISNNHMDYGDYY